MKDLSLNQLRITRAGKEMIDLTVQIRGGEVLTIMGPSGAGKSTALAAILGTLPDAFQRSGQILLNGQEISTLPTHERRVGLLFQDDVLFPHLSVGANLAFAIPTSVKGRQARAQMVDDALNQAGLAGYAPRDPATLSGGQRARVALMRALLAEPCALLLDEPFSRLDAALRIQIRAFTLQTIRDRQIPAILVTHDAEDAVAAGGQILSPLGHKVVL
ncbi:ATP-binding cassette domain-containing protein [Pseudotabrizicola sp. L79]|uniref:ATP-binding cassette domain-containing protein n=1 Tax=Pseudotabrizicola sp. L79 TaxID=3118402 RepID=UPI002F9379B7